MKNRHLFATMLGVMLADATPSSFSLRAPVKTYRNGPCKKCGQPNVRRGRETGVYLCEKCYEPNV